MRIKRIYEAPEPSDGMRVLVDRLWPRGMKKADADLDLWLKEVAPSAELRKSWHADPVAHDPAHFAAFSESYSNELATGASREALDRLVSLARESERLTLLYGARDRESNHAVVLRDTVLQRSAELRRSSG